VACERDRALSADPVRAVPSADVRQGRAAGAVAYSTDTLMSGMVLGCCAGGDAGLPADDPGGRRGMR